VLVKFRNAARSADGSRVVPVDTTDAALRDAWDYVINDVKSGNAVGRPIVVMSYGFDRPVDAPIISNREAILASALDECNRNDIVTIIAAGNDGLIDEKLHFFTPQNLGSTSNPLITVGGVATDGKLWPETRPQEAGQSGQYSE
jgi:hypothetical protein